MSEDPLSNFSCLDELTQVIYQSIYKFVVLSTVSNNKWNIHVGLAGREGRWWRGCWTEDDIRQIFGSKSSDKLLESFAEKLAEVFIQGELCISEWSAEKGAKIKFTLGPASKKPMHVDLVEMSPEEGAAFATGIFIDIALQAQSRKCRLYPSSSTEYPAVSETFATTSRTTSHSVAGPSKRKEPSPEPERPSKRPEASVSVNKETKKSSEVEAAQAEIKALKSQLQASKRGPSPAQKPAPAPVRHHKGASLANPNKKARKYQAIEFGSDDD